MVFINGAWGFTATDHDWKSQQTVARMLARVVSKGGKYLLNFGPTAEGELPAESVNILKQVGAWLRVNGESVYGTSGSPFPHLSWGVATRKGGRLYLDVFDWPKDGKLIVPLSNPAKSATLLATGKPLPVKSAAGKLVIDVPVTALDAADSVIALQIEGEPVTPPMKQQFTLEAFVGGEWKKIAEGKTEGHGKSSKITPVTAQKFRLTMACEKGSPGVAELQ